MLGTWRSSHSHMQRKQQLLTTNAARIREQRSKVRRPLLIACCRCAAVAVLRSKSTSPLRRSAPPTSTACVPSARALRARSSLRDRACWLRSSAGRGCTTCWRCSRWAWRRCSWPYSPCRCVCKCCPHARSPRRMSNVLPRRRFRHATQARRCRRSARYPDCVLLDANGRGDACAQATAEPAQQGWLLSNLVPALFVDISRMVTVRQRARQARHRRHLLSAS
jgi:hypothetical protein